MNNKLILFDWGNIVESHITGYTCKKAWDDLFKKCGYEDASNIYEKLTKYNLDKITSMQEFNKIYNNIKKEFKLVTTFENFCILYREIFDMIDYYKEVADYEKSLKDRCHIGIFSDLNVLDKDRLNKQVNLAEYEYIFLSFEIGIKKSEYLIYKYVQDKVPFKNEDILFIDDKEDNIELAKKCGLNTLQATGLELDKIKEVCEKFLNN